MSTNFYKVIPLPVKVREKMHDAINNNRVTVTNNITEYYDENGDIIKVPDTKIHIGKYSNGWIFEFAHNDWMYYDRTEKSIEDFVNNEYPIYDEYDREISKEEFWKWVNDSYNNWHDGEKPWDSESYIKHEIKQGKKLHEYEREINDFYVGRYRVCKFKEWF